MKKFANKSEKLFARLCEKQFLKHYIFYKGCCETSNGEIEVGDLIFWLRDILIVVELLWREKKDKNTKSFVKRIGEKRKQLKKDRKYFESEKEIYLLNGNEQIKYWNNAFHIFHGIIVIDSKIELDKLDHQQYKKTLNEDFPIAIMRKNDFQDLFEEIDTVPDLYYYLFDRYKFVKKLFNMNSHIFRDLNINTEKELIGYYKYNENNFPLENWDFKKFKKYWKEYKSNYKNKIIKRNLENRKSYKIDKLIYQIRNIHEEGKNDKDSIKHAWQLSLFTRRGRAQFADKILSGFERIHQKNKKRFFSIQNPVSECWLFFYFKNSMNSEKFQDIAYKEAQNKLIFEMKKNKFEHSVFLYSFRKSSIDTGRDFDEIYLDILDADMIDTNSDSFKNVNLEELDKCGYYEPMEIKEFPD
ncbi:MAG: hypothetical protein FXF54_00275 [Kosmotoga sp.]|nr:MAG: hypothetical protein FXF54_00275 [Kosmotoga sp.]